MQTTMIDLGPQCAEVARVVAAVPDDRLGDPTPDAGTPVAGLLDHLAGLTTAFTMAARKEPLGSGGPRASAAELRSGQFGPVVPVPDDAPAFDRVLGLTGRSPSWRP